MTETSADERTWRAVMVLLAGKNEAELCRKAGIAQSTFSTQKSNKRFELGVLRAIAPHLGTTAGELVDPRPSVRPEVALEALQRIAQVIRWAQADPPDEALAEDLLRHIVPQLPHSDTEGSPGAAQDQERPTNGHAANGSPAPRGSGSNRSGRG